MEPQGYVLQIKGKDGDTDVFAATYHALKAQCLADAIWFGWCETEMCLPCRLKDPSDALDPRWDVARIFTKYAELRAQRRGDRRITLLLTENGALAKQMETDLGAVRHQFSALESHRILAGKKPKHSVRKGSSALIEVAYPRELDYDVGVVNPEQMLVADVRCYYDNLHRLKFVRYCNIHPEEIGEIEVKPYE